MTLEDILPLVVVAIAILAVCAYGVYTFCTRPTSEQIAKVREWLLYAVAYAERELGGGTGQLKLRYVYDMFMTKFPMVANFLSFDTFEDMVVDALDAFEGMLKTNPRLDNYVHGPKYDNNLHLNGTLPCSKSGDIEVTRRNL